ncbi:MAG: amidohydrolase [Saprospiraceae bacterium]|nr:amidohydrolase [Saprospiraceae bacterium]
MNELKLKLIQMPFTWESAEQNRTKLEKILFQNDDSDLIILPEMWSTGFSMNPENLYEEMNGPTIKFMKSIATKLNSAICGSLIIKDSGQFFNRFVMATPEGDIHFYDKRHCFSLAKEDYYFTPGDRRVIINYKGWRICPMICYDLRFPVWSRNNNEFDILLYVAQFPEKRRKAWLSLLAARAIENVCYVIGVNGIGTDGNNIQYSGDSGVWDYEGNNILDLGSKHCTDTGSLNIDKLTAFRRAYPFLNDQDKFIIPK